MGMSVLFRGTPVGGPARMAKAGSSAQRGFSDELSELRDLADAALEMKLPGAVEDRKPSRVVAAVLQPLQALHEERRGFLLAYVAYDPAHAPPPLTRPK